jgi:two-component system NarL family sensor kinase
MWLIIRFKGFYRKNRQQYKKKLYTEVLINRLYNNIEIMLYKVIQECVNNVIKPAGANTPDISLIKDRDGIAATIEDSGCGLDIRQQEKFAGIGWKNIVTRIII